jgi:DNA-binding response OmpR family regulator
MKILVAEDAPEGRRMLEVMLGRWNYQVVTAANGEEALEILRSDDVRIALVDWMMPRLDGIEVCRRARQDPDLEGRYLILLTGRSEKSDIVTGLEAGADDYLVKPVDAPELRSRLRVGERVVALQSRLAERVRELQEALAHVQRLEGLIPICAYCKRVRNEEEYWERVEQYIQSRSSARFSHGICPECLARIEAEEGHHPGP